ncbi:MAG: hypothetical protein Kow0040_29740 [Thermogutta sp.]
MRARVGMESAGEKELYNFRSEICKGRGEASKYSRRAEIRALAETLKQATVPPGGKTDKPKSVFSLTEPRGKNHVCKLLHTRRPPRKPSNPGQYLP